MTRLVVNPGSPQPLEIHLKPGVNSLGRGTHNDFQISDVSVSGSHCQITVGDDGVSIKDLGSTNGTFLNQKQIQEAQLQNGQTLRLGNVEIAFYSDVPAAAAAPTPKPSGLSWAPVQNTPATLSVAPAPVPTAPAVVAPALAVAGARPGLRLSGVSHAPETPEVPASGAAEPPVPPPIADISNAPKFCKFHPKSQAHYFCSKCNRAFCDLCVSSRAVGEKVTKTCRSCGVPVAELKITFTAPVQRSFYASLPGAFVYPFRGGGIIVIIVATIIFAALDFIPSIWAKVALYGLMFLYMQNIIHSTTSDESESLGFPEVDGLGGAALQLGGTVLMSFGIPIGLIVARFFDVDIPVQAIIATVVLGCIYFPMAFLAVAMKDSVAAGNPLVVIPSILRIPGPYFVTSILLVGIYGFDQLGNLLSKLAGGVTFSARDVSTVVIAILIQVVWAFLSLYLLTVNMRILGLMYNSKKDELGWF